MKCSAGYGRRPVLRARACGVLVVAGFAVPAALMGCGGGSGGGAASTGVSAAPPTATGGAQAPAVVFARSQVLGQPSPQELIYVAAVPPLQAAVQASNGGSLLRAGSTLLTAEFIPDALSDVQVACVSGNGTSIGVLDAINPGVVTVSAAILFGAQWSETDASTAWAAAAAAAEKWNGWENCGVKPEGAASRSSSVAPASNGGYAEDIFIGNPSSNFTTLRFAISPSEAANMRASGTLTTEDPLRPLRITWRAFKDTAGNTVWVERGEPAAGATAATSATAATRGFITLFIPDRQR